MDTHVALFLHRMFEFAFSGGATMKIDKWLFVIVGYGIFAFLVGFLIGQAD